MQLTEGSVVRSIAGRDKGDAGIVVGFDRGWPLIADGRTRKIERPKRKNPKHLAVTREIIDLSLVTGNQTLKRLLLRFREAFDGSERE